jgi:FixJ family two-component response regulator
MMHKRAFVAVVDDDESVREALPDLLRELGHESEAFISAEEYLKSDRLGGTSCLLLDLAMPGMSGVDLKRELDRRDIKIPIIFITAHGDELVRQRLRERGAVDCLLKPFTDTALQDALNSALQTRPKS